MTRDWNRLPDATPDATACPDCGAPIRGGRRACRELFHETNRLDRTEVRPMRIGRLLVDSYALQHLDPYCRTAKELIYHIASMCCGLEFGGSAAIYAALQRSIDGPFRDDHPTPPRDLGDFTITSVSEAVTDADRVEHIDAWARSVWDAYSELRNLGRDWIERAMAK